MKALGEIGKNMSRCRYSKCFLPRSLVAQDIIPRTDKSDSIQKVKQNLHCKENNQQSQHGVQNGRKTSASDIGNSVTIKNQYGTPKLEMHTIQSTSGLMNDSSLKKETQMANICKCIQYL